MGVGEFKSASFLKFILQGYKINGALITKVVLCIGIGLRPCFFVFSGTCGYKSRFLPAQVVCNYQKIVDNLSYK